MITKAQHRQISADMAVRLVHWMMDTKDIVKSIAKERATAKRDIGIANDYIAGVKLKVIKETHKCSNAAIKSACIKHSVHLRRNGWRYE